MGEVNLNKNPTETDALKDFITKVMFLGEGEVGPILGALSD